MDDLSITITRVQCPECEARLKIKYMAAHLEDRHNFRNQWDIDSVIATALRFQSLQES